jgi:hypothetical protein
MENPDTPRHVAINSPEAPRAEPRAHVLRKRLAFASTFVMRSSSVFVSNSPKAYPTVAGRRFAAIDWAMLKRERAYCARVDRHSAAISSQASSRPPRSNHPVHKIRAPYIRPADLSTNARRSVTLEICQLLRA